MQHYGLYPIVAAVALSFAACAAESRLPSVAEQPSETLVAPVLANAGADREILAGYQAALDSALTLQPQQTSFDVRWEQIAGPPVYLSNVAALSPSFTAPLQECALSFRLTADDGAWTTTDEVTLYVRRTLDHTAPRVRAGADRFADYGASLSPLATDLLQVAPEDAEVSWESVSYTASQEALRHSASDSDPGAAPIVMPVVYRVQARINELGSAPDYLLLWPYSDEHRGERAPVAGVGDATPAMVTTGEGFTIDATNSADPNGDAFSVRWVQIRGDSVLREATNDTHLSVTAPTRTQELVFRLTVADAVLESAPVDVAIVVRAPTTATAADVAPPPELRAHVGNSVTLDAAFGLEATPGTSDDDGGAPPAITYHWEQTVGPKVVLTQAAEEDGRYASFVAPAATAATTLPLDLGFAVHAICDGVESSPAVTRVTVVPGSDNNAPAVTLCATSLAPQPGQVVSLHAVLAEPESDRISSLTWEATGIAAAELLAGIDASAELQCDAPVTPGLRFVSEADAQRGDVHFTAPTSGSTVVVKLTACDELAACASAEATVTVR